MDNVQNCDILIHHRHKPIDSINLLGSSGDVMCFL
jgi:hypothetical protein